MRKIVVYQNEVMNVDELLTCMEDNVKYFLIDEGPALEKVKIGDMPLIKLLANKGINLETYNVIQKDVDGINITRNKKLVPFFYAQHIEPVFKNQRIEKHFGIFINRSRWNRMFLASHLFEYHRDKSVINFRQTIKNEKQPCRLCLDDLFENTYNINSDQFLGQINNFLSHLPLELTDEPNDNTWGNINSIDTLVLNEFYKKIFVDVVCETWHEGTCFYPTEKTSRPMLCYTPFLVYAGKDYLKNLRKMGFKTFSQWWDESYDEYDGKERVLRIAKICNELAKKSLDEIAKMYDEMRDTLKHNYITYRDCKEVEMK
jgi:hypothetical protein